MSAMKLGALALALSGILHFVAVVAAGFAGSSLLLPVFGLIYLALAAMLWQNEARMIAWIVFILMLVIPVIALGQMGPDNPVPASIMWAILVLDWICLACMFVALWRNRHPV